MDKYRIYHSIKLLFCPAGIRRAEYIKDNNIFSSFGDNCSVMLWKIPLYPKLIKIGNNVKIASNVTFITHDISYAMLNDRFGNYQPFIERKGCIEIGDNVYIGFGVSIMPNVKIASNTVIGAGSIVTKDVSGGVYVGIPAHRIMDFDSYVEKNLARSKDHYRDEQDYWHDFYQSRGIDAF